MACGEPERRSASHRNSNLFKKGNKTKPSTENKVAGKLHEVKGKSREKMGRLTNDRDLERSGLGEKIAGKIQKHVGQIERVVKK